ncbi:hypothetical protein BX666DRAFT_1857703 [Dichotomocladium elegans]|nr:hypothetical protein BX666DRAFT_1857703 [Dichotomocladium elegans]
MDPGKSHLDHLKLVPNLVEEDPAAITPVQQKAYMDMPWKDFSAMLQKNKHEAEEAAHKRHSQHVQLSEAEVGGWDSETGYQDKQHASMRH